jgi:valyl-tRNA synthetase
MSPASEIPKQYDPKAAEAKWYPLWKERGYFHSEPDPARRPYTIIIPPPNVTGALHLGHALNNTLQDILIRFKRMQGYNALWMPGTDHAGIATQAVVERRLLAEEGKTRHDLGRDALVDRIWAWKDEYEARILGQLERLGASCDWQRTRFTFDEQCARAVRHTFFRWFKAGLIYRGKRLVNWDTFLQTAVSDDEVYHDPVPGHFWHFRYPVIGSRPGEPDHVTIATTRPETMLGDTAVAVHPDPRAALVAAEAELRQKLASCAEKERLEVHGQLEDLGWRRTHVLPMLITLAEMARAGRTLRLPLVDREIPLIVDEWARPELGSGCVKITPAHDPNDYEVGKRQGLPMINILNPDGTLNTAAGAYAGLAIPEARRRVVHDLTQLGLVERVEDREIDLAHSDRSKTPIEPLLCDQWFVRMTDLAQSAMDAVTDGRVKMFPPRYAKGYLDWLGEKRDWPISRQLWWGHQIPVWYALTATEDDLTRAFSGREDIAWCRDELGSQWLICSRDSDLDPHALPGHELRREPDVLDTWFSSALWPHSTLGWPSDTAELRYYYPTDTLSTSRDIITLWVARMVLTGLFNVGDVPFRSVYVHPKILDAYGETMSKSKGNGVDPVDVINKFGADALRFGLAFLATETQDIRMGVAYECPHCGHNVEQTRENRDRPRMDCPQCGKPFGTQWASKAEDVNLPRALVVSERFELARNFANKLWNAARFTLLNLEGYEPQAVAAEELEVEDRWIKSRLATVTDEVTSALDDYRFGDAMRTLYSFAWDEFCSFYLEMVKSRLADPASRPTAQRVLAGVLDVLVRLLHPAIPFLTEEIWQRLSESAGRRGLVAPGPPAESVMIAPWPERRPEWQDPMIEAQFSLFQDVLKGLRDVRSRQNIAPKTPVAFRVKCDQATADLLRPMASYFHSMAGARAEAWGPTASPPSLHASVSTSKLDLYVDLAGLLNVEAEISRQEKERARLASAIQFKENKLANAQFVSRAPAAVVEQERTGLAQLRDQLSSVEAVLVELKSRA